MASRCDQDCRICEGRSKTIFADLGESEMDLFVRARTLTRYKKKERIFYQGEPCAGMHLVCHGRVKLAKSTESGREQIIGIADPGELLEGTDLFIGDRHSMSAVALEETQICFIKKADFTEFLHRTPSVAMHFINVLGTALAEARAQIERLTFKTARQRLAELLLQLAEDYGQPGSEGVILNIRLKREDLAEMIGVSQETAIRLLSGLKRDRMLKDQDHHLVILDEAGLKNVAH